MVKNKYVVYDLEVFPNFFSYTDIDIETNEVYQFYIHEDNIRLEEFKKFKDYVLSLSGMIGFNNVNYDYPVLNEIIRYDKPISNTTIYYKSQEIINLEFSSLPAWLTLVKQLDLFRIHHFDNKAKRTSLKDVQFVLKWKKVQDLPYKYDHFVQNKEIEEILEYNLNDVLSTFEFYKASLEQIKLRKDLSKQFKIDFINHNDPKLGSDIFLDMISSNTGIEKKELKLMRTQRNRISFKEIILDYIKFETNEFKSLLDRFKSINITQTKGAIKESLIYEGLKYEYGTGGIHACINEGIYESDETEGILDIDVASFYPNLAINNNFRPAHLGVHFTKAYKYTYDTRSSIPKKDIRNGAYKLALNGVFGKSNEPTSWLYDPKFTMQITVNGQLLISMLAEKFVLLGITILQCNTDGITIKYKHELRSKIEDICKWFESLTKLKLEFQEYRKMVIRDVNSYLAITVDNKPKYKGCFEIIKTQNGQIAYNKDWSMRIVPIALSEYFINNIPVENTIKNHKDIFDFCCRQKTNSDCYSETRGISYDENSVAYLLKNKQQKTTRYYISTNGLSFYRVYHSGKQAGTEEAIEKNRLVTIFNNYEEKDIKQYNIDYDYYIKECYKIINVVDNKQLTLF